MICSLWVAPGQGWAIEKVKAGAIQGALQQRPPVRIRHRNSKGNEKTGHSRAFRCIDRCKTLAGKAVGADRTRLTKGPRDEALINEADCREECFSSADRKPPEPATKRGLCVVYG